jgi:hypothetical protein
MHIYYLFNICAFQFPDINNTSKTVMRNSEVRAVLEALTTVLIFLVVIDIERNKF